MLLEASQNSAERASKSAAYNVLKRFLKAAKCTANNAALSVT